MITVRLKGGLGNQMFQYAFAKALSKQKNTTFQLDIRYLLDRTYRHNFVFRNYDLNIFNIENNIYNGKRLNPIKVYFDLALNIIFKVSPLLLKVKSNYFLELEQRYYSNFLTLSTNTYFCGYFQSYHYFDPIKAEILKDFSFSKPISGKSVGLLVEIKSCNSLCINYRRTDFINNKFHDTITKDYYSKAVEEVWALVEIDHIYVFSDDIEWCLKNVKFNHKTTFVGREYNGGKFRNDLELMINCKHLIISNSSFAWWAAYLAPYKNKIVIAPKIWDKLGSREDLIPSDWLRI
jgi:Glycosyl transferase family 11